MIPIRKESEEVLYAENEVVVFGKADLEELKRLAMLTPRKRIRLCTHRNPRDSLHEMFIIHTKDTVVPPHKHIGKAESFSILEGRVDVILFHDDGKIRETIRMGDPASGLPFYYRLADPIFHTLNIHSDFLVFHEVTSGPFQRDKTLFASWDNGGDAQRP